MHLPSNMNIIKLKIIIILKILRNLRYKFIDFFNQTLLCHLCILDKVFSFSHLKFCPISINEEVRHESLIVTQIQVSVQASLVIKKR